MVAKALRSHLRAATWAVEPSEGDRIRYLIAAILIWTIVNIVGIIYFGRMTSVATVSASIAFAAVAILACRKAAALSDRIVTLRAAFDLTPEARLIIAPDGQFEYTNRAFNQLFPGESDQPLDRVEPVLCPDAESQVQFRRLRSLAAAGTHGSATLPLSNGWNAEARRFHIKVDPIAGRCGYSLWRIRNTTARCGIDPRTLANQGMLADLLDNAPIGIYSVDRDGRFRFANRTLAKWLGTTSEVLTGGARLRDFLASPMLHEGAAAGRSSERELAILEGEVMLKTSHGQVVPAWIAQTVVGSDSDLRTRSVVCDLTPERGWGAALRSFDRFRSCFINAPVGIALLDRLGRFEEVNRVVGELLNTTPENLKGEKLTDLLIEDDRERIIAKLTAAADGRTDGEAVEVRPKRPGDRTLVLFLGRLHDSDYTVRSESTPGGALDDGLTLYFIDVTEQKNLEIQFAQSQKMQAVGQLAGGVAHDFNNLLTAMIGFCDLLLLRASPSDPSFADVMQIKQNANRAANLVRQLLAFSRQQTLQPRVLDITDILYELRHLIERLIGENINLEVVHGRGLGLVKVDQGQFEQVIINLAVNARDAMPDGGTLTIRTANLRQDHELRRGHEVMPAGNYILIEVTDVGIGIPRENLARIFDPFFSTKQLGSGTGLGLSTVYGIVKQTGGFVFVDSTPGHGTVFQIYLPRCEAAEEVLPARPGIAEPVAVKDLTGQGTIMLVEDDDPVRIFGARALRNKGYRVVEAKSGEAALDLIRNARENIDLLITDVVMPHMDGPGLVREVREIHPEMKVIFISGYTEDAFRQRLDSEGGIDFLPKPFSLKQLAAKVRDVLVAST
jgi:two-component system, cell cycle sensor histidine kinase and response regulator CckA